MAKMIDSTTLQRRNKRLETYCKRIVEDIDSKRIGEQRTIEDHKQEMESIVQTLDSISLKEQDFSDYDEYIGNICIFVDLLKCHPQRRTWGCSSDINKAWSYVGSITFELAKNLPDHEPSYYFNITTLSDHLHDLCLSEW